MSQEGRDTAGGKALITRDLGRVPDYQHRTNRQADLWHFEDNQHRTPVAKNLRPLDRGPGVSYRKPPTLEATGSLCYFDDVFRRRK